MPKKKLLTVEDVKERVKNIKNLSAFDPEAAHSRENSLYVDILKHISKLNCFDALVDEIAKISKEALKASKIKFPRHCS